MKGTASLARRHPKRVPRSEAAAAAVLLFALIAVVHYDVLFQGKSFVLTNHYNPLDYRVLPQNYGDHLVPPQRWTERNLQAYANIQDPGGSWWMWEPSGEFLRRAIAERELPFWDPYVGGGSPAMANLTQAFFFPPYLLVVALGASVTLKNAYFLCLIWSATFFTFLFLRRHDLSFASALCGATVVVMSGSVNQSIGTIMGQAVVCLPLCLYVTHLFLECPGRSRALALVLVYAGVSLASFPPILLGVFGAAALYAGVALALDDRAWRTRVRLALKWAVAAALSVGLVSFYYLPAMTLRAATPYVIAFYEGAGLQSMPIDRAYQLMSPTLMGGVGVYLDPPLNIAGPHVPYIGIAALIAVLLARPNFGKRASVLFYASATGAIIILLKLFGIPPVQWAGHLPLLNQIHFAHYFGFPLGFLLAFLAALGVESLWRAASSAKGALVTTAVVTIGTVSLWWVASRFQILRSPTDTYWIRDWLVLHSISSGTTLVLLTGTLVPKLRMATVASVWLLISAEGVYNNTYPSPSDFDLFRQPPPYVKALQEVGRDRVLAFAALTANLNSAFEIFSMDSLMTFHPPRPHELYKRYAHPPKWLFLREATAIPPDPVLDRANIRILAIRDAFPALMQQAEARGYSKRFTDGYVSLFERATLPRFFFSSDYRVMTAPEALEAIATAPSRELLLEETPPFPPATNGPGDPAVVIQAYRRNSVSLLVNAPRPGLVYAAESFADGWTARVNGMAARILPANYAFRAIEVPAGASRIEFSYWPPGLSAGLVASGLSAVLLAAFLVWIRVDERRGGRPGG